MLIRPQESARYVELGLLDVAVTGFDWILKRDVVEVAELVYSKQLRRPVRWVVAVPSDSSHFDSSGFTRQTHSDRSS